ncbi:MAG: acyltransferase, partial [Burkholderiales bacterium]
ERLDHLRFVAAALVVAFHAFHRHVPDLRADNPLLSLIDEGHTGIGLFMVISGFIFTVIAADATPRYWPFLRNRLLRIYPLYLFGAMLALAIATYNDHRNYGLLEFLGWLIPYRASTVADARYFVQLWTIWVEFQFYLVFPFLLLFARRFGLRYLIGWVALLIAVRTSVFVLHDSVRFIAYETIFGRMDQFLIGMLAGFAYRARPGRFAHPAQLLAAALAVIAAVHAFDRWGGHTAMQSAFWIAWPTLEALVWAWLLVAWLDARWRLPPALERGLARIGALSFSIYVMHNLVVALLDRAFGVLPLAADPIAASALQAVLVAVPLATLAAVPTWLLIERPFLALRVPYLQRSSEQPNPASRGERP